MAEYRKSRTLKKKNSHKNRGNAPNEYDCQRKSAKAHECKHLRIVWAMVSSSRHLPLSLSSSLSLSLPFFGVFEVNVLNPSLSFSSSFLIFFPFPLFCAPFFFSFFLSLLCIAPGVRA